MKKNIRTKKRMPFQKECILFNRFGLIKALTVDRSPIRLEVITEYPLPSKINKGCELTISDSGENFPRAKLMWTRKYNKTTRLGLKFLQ